MEGLFVCLLILSTCDGRARLDVNLETPAVAEVQTEVVTNQQAMEAMKVLDDFELRYQDSFEIIVSEELLAALDSIILQSFAKFENTAPRIMAGETLKIGLYAFMGYYGKDQCMKRSACEAGDLISRTSDTSTLALAALYYVTPKDWLQLMDVVQRGANGKSCFTYRCGRPLRSETDINRNI